MADLPELERPPTYASVDPRNTVDVNHQPDPQANFDNLSPTGGHELELHRAQDYARSTGIHVKSHGNTMYYAGHYHQAKESSDIILYGGYDAAGPWLAQAKFAQFTKDFKVYVGDHRTPTNDEWDNVRCSEGGFFSEPQFRFESRTKTGKAKYHWKKTHDSKLGASKLSPRDFKLVDESKDEVVAVYIEKHLGSGTVKGTIAFRKKVSEHAEVAALMVLLSLLEKSRRYMRHVATAFPNSGTGL